MFRRAIPVVCFAMVGLLALSDVAFANHCSAIYNTDIGPMMETPDGTIQTVSEDCTGDSGCNDYFDMILAAGDQVFLTFCSSGGTANFDTGLSVWSGPPGFISNRACSDDFCAFLSQVTFVASVAGTYRMRIGGFSGASGSYTLAYSAPLGSTIIGAIPICFEVDAIDDQFAVVNDGTSKDLSVLTNDECTGDGPISVVKLPGDLVPDRGGTAATDGSQALYRPATGFVGFEEFTYTAQDAGLEGGEDPPSVDQDTAVVVVNVLQDIAPDAVDDEATTLQSQSINIDVLDNDSLGNVPNAVAVESAPANGSATLQSDDTIRYFPNFSFFGEDSFEYRLTDANGDSDVATVTVGVFFLRGQVPIDIMPSDAGNNLNLISGQGAGINIAILSVGEFFDAPTLIDPLTLKFGPRQANIWGSPQFRDVNGDGDDDLIVKFLTQQTGIACGDTQASLSGRTFDRQSISGSDAINTFNCPRIRKRH